MQIDAISNIFVDKKEGVQKSESGFLDLVEKFIADVNTDLQAASIAKDKLIEGRVDNMVALMATVEKADISLRLATELRNKALEAYQEIMRMQV